MKIKYFVIFILGLSLFSSCEKEEMLTPMPLDILSRFVFPEGDDPLDQRIAEINEKFDIKIIYKKLVESDFSRSWTGDLGKN